MKALLHLLQPSPGPPRRTGLLVAALLGFGLASL
jgi:hypothetical protein